MGIGEQYELEKTGNIFPENHVCGENVIKRNTTKTFSNEYRLENDYRLEIVSIKFIHLVAYMSLFDEICKDQKFHKILSVVNGWKSKLLDMKENRLNTVGNRIYVLNELNILLQVVQTIFIIVGEWSKFFNHVSSEIAGIIQLLKEIQNSE